MERGSVFSHQQKPVHQGVSEFMVIRSRCDRISLRYNINQTVSILEGYASPSEVARIAEFNEGRRKFLSTGRLHLPGQMAGITIG